MKALSIKQPWAWLICAGYKDVENRNWHLHMPPLQSHPSYAKNVPMRIYVHTGKRFDVEGDDALLAVIRRICPTLYANRTDFDYFCDIQSCCPLGAIIGEVDIVGCKFRDPDENANLYSPWHVPGQYGFLLKNPVLYAHPIPYKGRLGFFTPDIEKKG